jgi:hypothetical protein
MLYISHVTPAKSVAVTLRQDNYTPRAICYLPSAALASTIFSYTFYKYMHG